MNINARALIVVAVAFLAGALVFAPLRSLAGPVAPDGETDGLMPVGNGSGGQFIVKNGFHIYLFQVETTADGKSHLVEQDMKSAR